MKTKALPKSKAKTAYGLLSEVCELITEEPKRYAQRFYIARKGKIATTKRTSYLADDNNEVSDFPACGTVGCVAGWVTVLKGPKRFRYWHTHSIAAKILGLPDNQDGWSYQSDELFGSEAATGNSQTPEHAAAGVAHIKKFQAKYASQLRAKRV